MDDNLKKISSLIGKSALRICFKMEILYMIYNMSPIKHIKIADEAGNKQYIKYYSEHK